MDGAVILCPDGSVAVQDTCPCDDAAPCECPEGGLVGCYRLADYTDGDLAACETCEDHASGAWDGTFEVTSGCLWVGSGSSISGKRIGIHAFPTLLLDEPNCVWAIAIACETDAWGGAAYIWRGTKATGSTPVGPYTRTAGCDETSTLTVEECPE